MRVQGLYFYFFLFLSIITKKQFSFFFCFHELVHITTLEWLYCANDDDGVVHLLPEKQCFRAHESINYSQKIHRMRRSIMEKKKKCMQQIPTKKEIVGIGNFFD